MITANTPVATPHCHTALPRASWITLPPPAWLDAVLLGLIAVRPADRFDDALECVFALEHGALQATPAPLPRLPLPRLPLIERDPLRFWQTVSAVLALLLLLLALWR